MTRISKKPRGQPGRPSLPLHIHASGDRAIARALDAIGADSAPGATIIGFDLSPDRELAATPRFGNRHRRGTIRPRHLSHGRRPRR